MIEMIIMDAGEDRNIRDVLLPQEPPPVKPASKASRFVIELRSDRNVQFRR